MPSEAMSVQSIELGLGLLALAMPTTMIAWTIAILAIGGLRDPADQPLEFRIIASRAQFYVSKHYPDLTSIAAAIVFWGLGNFPPIYVLVVRPHGGAGLDVSIVYLAVQALWLLRIRRAIVRAGGDHGGSPMT
jgi:hypothetical protein